jgi:uncharacterized protein YwqG
MDRINSINERNKIMESKNNSHYEPQSTRELKNSPAYHLALFQSDEVQAKEEILDEFLDFVQDEFEISQEDMSDLQALVNAFVGYDIKKVEQAEKEKLQAWKTAVS